MNNIILISDKPAKKLPIVSDEDAKKKNNKGWSFFYIYHLRELRDIYMLSSKYKNITPKGILQEVTELIKTENSTKIWNERSILENINTLKNLKLMNRDGNIIGQINFNSTYNEPLSEHDLQVFQKLFYSYHRFQELSTWLIDPNPLFHSRFDELSLVDFVEKSRPIYYFINTDRFINTFFYSLKHNEYKYVIDEKSSHVMRFWEVFIKWGITLNIIDKFSLSKNGFKTDNNKELTIAYFIKPFCVFDLINFIKSRDYDSRTVRIPDLILDIATEYRYSVIAIKQFLKDEILSNDKLTYSRTSQIFIIKGKEKKKKIADATYLYPIIDNSYISHIIIRR